MIKIKATKQRDSNFELLRLISMLLVVFTHVSFWALGAPGLEDIQRNFTDATIRVSLQSLGIPCVNIFVMISGWYGIKPSRLGVTAFLFQCIFYSICFSNPPSTIYQYTIIWHLKLIYYQSALRKRVETA